MAGEREEEDSAASCRRAEPRLDVVDTSSPSLNSTTLLRHTAAAWAPRRRMQEFDSASISWGRQPRVVSAPPMISSSWKFSNFDISFIWLLASCFSRDGKEVKGIRALWSPWQKSMEAAEFYSSDCISRDPSHPGDAQLYWVWIGSKVDLKAGDISSNMCCMLRFFTSSND